MCRTNGVGPERVAMSQLITGPGEARPDWEAYGACVDVDPEDFYVPDGLRGAQRQPYINKAKAVCDRCTVLAACRADALKRGEKHGVWGGLSEDERKQLVKAGKTDVADVPDKQVVDLLVEGVHMPGATVVDKAHAAVILFAGGGYTKTGLARKLGVTGNMVFHWIRKAGEGKPPISEQHIAYLRKHGKLTSQTAATVTP